MKYLIAILYSTFFVYTTAIAQSDYPNKPIRAIVPFAPGGPSDLVARVTSQKISQSIGQPIVLENEGGAGGLIGGSIVAKSKSDGYTILLSTATMVTAPVFTPDISVNQSEFEPVALIAHGYGFVLLVSPNLPVNSVAELIAYAKEHPNKLNYGDTGIGNPTQIAPQAFLDITNIKMTGVHYKGSAPVTADLLGGFIDLAFAPTQNALPYVQSGKLKALAITGTSRWPSLPDVPTLKEVGVNFSFINWFGAWVPAKTSPKIVQKLQKEIANAVKDPDLKKQFAEAGLVPVGSTTEEFIRFIESENIKMINLAKKLHQ